MRYINMNLVVLLVAFIGPIWLWHDSAFERQQQMLTVIFVVVFLVGIRDYFRFKNPDRAIRIGVLASTYVYILAFLWLWIFGNPAGAMDTIIFYFLYVGSAAKYALMEFGLPSGSKAEKKILQRHD